MIQDLWIRFKRFVLPYPMAYVVKYTLKIILWTCRLEVQGLERFIDCAKNNRCILSLWHNRLAVVPEVVARYAKDFYFNAVISNSRDGEPLAILVRSYRQGKVMRVAHNDRRGALSNLIKHAKGNTDIIVITPDGPRGPCYQLKPGIIMAAKSSGAYVVPFCWTADTFWSLKSWDKFMLPKPFSKIRVVFGAPVALPKDTSLDEDKAFLQQHMMPVDQNPESV